MALKRPSTTTWQWADPRSPANPLPPAICALGAVGHLTGLPVRVLLIQRLDAIHARSAWVTTAIEQNMYELCA